MEHVSVQCPHCGKGLKAKAAILDRTVKCPACGESFKAETPAQPADISIVPDGMVCCDVCGTQLAEAAADRIDGKLCCPSCYGDVEAGLGEAAAPAAPPAGPAVPLRPSLTSEQGRSGMSIPPPWVSLSAGGAVALLVLIAGHLLSGSGAGGEHFEPFELKTARSIRFFGGDPHTRFEGMTIADHPELQLRGGGMVNSYYSIDTSPLVRIYLPYSEGFFFVDLPPLADNRILSARDVVKDGKPVGMEMFLRFSGAGQSAMITRVGPFRPGADCTGWGQALISLILHRSLSVVEEKAVLTALYAIGPERGAGLVPELKAAARSARDEDDRFVKRIHFAAYYLSGGEKDPWITRSLSPEKRTPAIMAELAALPKLSKEDIALLAGYLPGLKGKYYHVDENLVLAGLKRHSPQAWSEVCFKLVGAESDKVGRRAMAAAALIDAPSRPSAYNRLLAGILSEQKRPGRRGWRLALYLRKHARELGDETMLTLSSKGTRHQKTLSAHYCIQGKSLPPHGALTVARALHNDMEFHRYGKTLAASVRRLDPEAYPKFLLECARGAESSAALWALEQLDKLKTYPPGTAAALMIMAEDPKRRYRQGFGMKCWKLVRRVDKALWKKTNLERVRTGKSGINRLIRAHVPWSEIGPAQADYLLSVKKLPAYADGTLRMLRDKHPESLRRVLLGLFKKDPRMYSRLVIRYMKTGKKIDSVLSQAVYEHLAGTKHWNTDDRIAYALYSSVDPERAGKLKAASRKEKK